MVRGQKCLSVALIKIKDIFHFQIPSRYQVGKAWPWTNAPAYLSSSSVSKEKSFCNIECRCHCNNFFQSFSVKFQHIQNTWQYGSMANQFSFHGFSLVCIFLQNGRCQLKTLNCILKNRSIKLISDKKKFCSYLQYRYNSTFQQCGMKTWQIQMTPNFYLSLMLWTNGLVSLSLVSVSGKFNIRGYDRSIPRSPTEQPL